MKVLDIVIYKLHPKSSASVEQLVSYHIKGPGFDFPLGFLKVWAKISIRGRILIHSFPEPLGIK